MKTWLSMLIVKIEWDRELSIFMYVDPICLFLSPFFIISII